MKPYTIEELLTRIPKVGIPQLAPPPYEPRYDTTLMDLRPRVGLAVESMKRHTTDEGWQIFSGLRHTGYELAGFGLTTVTPTHFPFPNKPGEERVACSQIVGLTNVKQMIHVLNPSVVVMQDKREWDCGPRDFREKRARFSFVESLSVHRDVFKLTVLKDAHQRPAYHRQSAEEIGCHAWIVYYHPKIVSHLAPYLRPKHLIRTYHTIDSDIVPDFKTKDRLGCLLSGAVSGAYPLRKRLFEESTKLPETTVLRHPGYHMQGCLTPLFLKTLNQFKVAICTSSMYGYALRKIIEATACGCMVITDLPVDEVLPHIDENLIRVRPEITTEEMASVIQTCYSSYNTDKQLVLAHKAITHYDYRTMGIKLNQDIEEMRRTYNASY